MISPSSRTFRASEIVIIRSGLDIWRQHVAKKVAFATRASGSVGGIPRCVFPPLSMIYYGFHVERNARAVSARTRVRRSFALPSSSATRLPLSSASDRSLSIGSPYRLFRVTLVYRKVGLGPGAHLLGVLCRKFFDTQLATVLLSLPKIILDLLIQPAFRRRAKRNG